MQAGEYAPEARPTTRQHQLQPPKQAAPALHSACSARWIYVKTFMTGLAIYCPSSSKRGKKGHSRADHLDLICRWSPRLSPVLPVKPTRHERAGAAVL